MIKTLFMYVHCAQLHPSYIDEAEGTAKELQRIAVIISLNIGILTYFDKKLVNLTAHFPILTPYCVLAQTGSGIEQFFQIEIS